MAKKATAEQPAVGLDTLSSEWVDSVVLGDTGAVKTSSNASKDDVVEGMGDKEADKILNVAKQKEAAAKKESKAAPKAEEPEEEEEPEHKEEPEEEPEEDVDPKKDEDKVAIEAADKKKKGDKTDDKSELSFDETGAAAPNAAEGETNGWKEVAKAVYGVDLEEDTFEKFEQIAKEKSELSLAKYKPETQRLIKALDNGMTIEDFVEPLKPIDQALALSDVDLVDRHLIGTGWKDEVKRAAKLEAMIESGEVEVVGAQARESLNALRETRKNEIIEARAKAQELYERRAVNAPKEESKAIKSVLDAKAEFMGTKLSTDNREKIIKKYAEGVYEKEFKNPELIAEFLLWKEYGKKGMENLKIQAQRELKEKHKDKFHVVPPKNNAAAGSSRSKSTSSGKDPVGNFEALENERE